MQQNQWLDLSPQDDGWGHHQVTGHEGVRIHYVRQGHGNPVILLHGWPGFWYDWRHVIPGLAQHADVITPDFRGYGDSEKPDLLPVEGYNPNVLALDIISLINQLNVTGIVLAAHDIGATVAQTIAKLAPEKIKSLVLLNPPYPGIGSRRFDPAVQGEFWYQHFHHLDWAERLVGYDRHTVEMYLSHFYHHWMGKKEALRAQEFQYIVDVYAREEAFKWSIAYYRARAGARTKEAAALAPSMKINIPTQVLWGTADPVILSSWSDRLHEYFEQVNLELLEDIGHFAPIEAPEQVIRAVQKML